MNWPRTTQEMKYTVARLELAPTTSSMTTFHASPASTWNTVTSALVRSSKLLRGTSGAGRWS